MYIRKHNFLTFIRFFFLLNCLSFHAVCQEESLKIPLGQEMLGVASFYDLPGNQTANGETMQKVGLTCAHRWYPFGTMLEITNLNNNKWVVVRVNDRGPYSGGRMLDLSIDAARAIGMVNAGTIKVKTMVVGDNGQIFITRADPISENTIKEAISEEIKEPLPILPKPEDKKKEAEQEKKVKDKRDNRRKKH